MHWEALGHIMTRFGCPHMFRSHNWRTPSNHKFRIRKRPELHRTTSVNLLCVFFFIYSAFLSMSHTSRILHSAWQPPDHFNMDQIHIINIYTIHCIVLNTYWKTQPSAAIAAAATAASIWEQTYRDPNSSYNEYAVRNRFHVYYTVHCAVSSLGTTATCC